MNQTKIQEYLDSMRSKNTDELLQILTDADTKKYPEEAFEAIRQLLANRSTPPPLEFPHRDRQQLAKEFSPFPVEGNAIARTSASDHIELKFPTDGGFLMPEKNKFKDRDDFLRFISELFPLANEKGSEGVVSVTRMGKYQRISRQGMPIFTFGNPILDLITDDNGSLTIGKEHFDLRAIELSNPKRGGGIQTIDTAPYTEDIRRAQVVDATLSKGKYTLIEATDSRVIVASRNPSSIHDFAGKNGHLRCRSWAVGFGNPFFVGGAEIETFGFINPPWPARFTWAVVNCDFVDTGSAPTCIIVKKTGGVDWNDTYVGTSRAWFFPPSAPNGIRARCLAYWPGGVVSGTVTTNVGSCGWFIEA